MSIEDLKSRLRDVPGIESLTMSLLGGRQNYGLAGKLISLDAGASNADVENTIRAAVASDALVQIPADAAPPLSPVAGVAVRPVSAPMIAAPANSTQGTAAMTTTPADTGLNIKTMMEQHMKTMADIHQAQLALLKTSLDRQASTVGTAVTSVAQKIDSQTAEFTSMMAQFTNGLGAL